VMFPLNLNSDQKVGGLHLLQLHRRNHRDSSASSKTPTWSIRSIVLPLREGRARGLERQAVTEEAVLEDPCSPPDGEEGGTCTPLPAQRPQF
jgi:hypothetical protein